MRKITIAVLGPIIGATALMSAEGTGVPTDSDVTVSTEVKEVNSAKGFYMGAGVGASLYNISMSEGTYFLGNDTNDPAYSISGDDLDELDDSDVGYTIYAGYQFNKIIAVEGAYTDYGSFSGKLKTIEYTKKPQSLAIYANAGYNFFNGELRPFGLLGIGYLYSDQSKSYDIQQVKEEFATLHAGFGVEYYPTVLKGFGIRASFTGDSYVDTDYTSYDNIDTVQSESLWQYYSLFYVGAQYKF